MNIKKLLADPPSDLIDYIGAALMKPCQHVSNTRADRNVDAMVALKALKEYLDHRSAEGPSQGGFARAEALTHEERSAIARKAARVRWGQKPLDKDQGTS